MVPTVPAYIVQRPSVAWDSGANSISMRTGDFRVFDFSVVLSGAVVVGLKSRRLNQLTPELIEHGMLFQLVGGLRYVRVVEYGEVKTGFEPFTDDEVFEIRRLRGVVTYYKGHRRLYTSTRISTGPRLVNACLYVSGDTVV